MMQRRLPGDGMSSGVVAVTLYPGVVLVEANPFASAQFEATKLPRGRGFHGCLFGAAWEARLHRHSLPPRREAMGWGAWTHEGQAEDGSLRRLKPALVVKKVA
jgi:hypothetical protein